MVARAAACSPVLPPCVREAEHDGAGHARKLVGGCQAPGGPAEEGHEHAVTASRVLVRREPQQPALLEVPDRRTQCLPAEHRGGVAQATVQHGPFQCRLPVRAIHAGQRHAPGQHPSAGLQGREMARHDDHPAPRGAGGLDVLQALDHQPLSQRRHRPPPGPRELEQADAQRFEVLLQQARTGRVVELREAQREVAGGDVPAAAPGGMHQPSQAAANGALQPPRQAGQQRCQPDPEPRRPGARAERRRCVGCVGLGHAPF